MEVRSVGNSQTLKETALIEAFNLKAAIEYTMKNVEAAKEALTDMPPRAEEELDPVTLHNSALINMDSDPTGARLCVLWGRQWLGCMACCCGCGYAVVVCD